jgi:hypothetical protein
LERAEVALDGAQTPRVAALRAQLADLEARREGLVAEQEMTLAITSITPIEREQIIPGFLPERQVIPERSIEEQVRDDLEQARGEPSVSIQEQVRTDLEQAGAVSTEASFEEMVRADLEQARGEPSVSIQEQVRVDLELGQAQASPSLADAVRLDLERAKIGETPRVRPSVLPRPFPEPGPRLEPAPAPVPVPWPEPKPDPLRLPTTTPIPDPALPPPMRPPSGVLKRRRERQDSPSTRRREQMAEWVGHKQGFIYRYKHLPTGKEVYSKTPIVGKVPPLKGKGSARKSSRIISWSNKAPTQLVDQMGIMRVEYTPDGRITFKRKKVR